MKAYCWDINICFQCLCSCVLTFRRGVECMTVCLHVHTHTQMPECCPDHPRNHHDITIQGHLGGSVGPRRRRPFAPWRKAWGCVSDLSSAVAGVSAPCFGVVKTVVFGCWWLMHPWKNAAIFGCSIFHIFMVFAFHLCRCGMVQLETGSNRQPATQRTL